MSLGLLRVVAGNGPVVGDVVAEIRRGHRLPYLTFDLIEVSPIYRAAGVHVGDEEAEDDGIRITRTVDVRDPDSHVLLIYNTG